MSIVHIPFYPSDWLAGTRGLSDAETGVYITLIARMYEMAAPIERDDERLYRLCGSKSKASFIKSLGYLISEGKVIETPDGLFNEKAAKVIQQTVEKSDKAKSAAQSRWDRKPNKNNDRGNANASHKHMPQPCQPEPEPEPYKKEGTNVPLSVSPPAIDEIAKSVSAYNATAARVGWPMVQKLSPARRAALVARLKDAGGADGWAVALSKAEASPFLTGQTGNPFRASFDFLTKQSNFTKLMEGNYDPRDSNQHSPSGRTGHGIGSGTADAFASVAADMLRRQNAGG
jgi:uncharacterized protein YdaU (DUF1376 family)